MTDSQEISYPQRRILLAVIAILLLALAVRFAIALQDRVVWGDEPFYLWLGRNWLTGQGYSFTGYPDVHHTPLYPLLAGVLYLLTGDLDVASRIWYVLLGAALVVPIYLIAARMYGQRAGLVAGLLVALHPALTAAIPRWGTMTEPLYYLLVYGGLYALLVALDRDAIWAWGLGGILLGLAYLTRPEASGYLLLFGAYLLLVRLLQKRLFTRHTLLALVAYIIGFAFFFVPYAVYVRIETGEWMVSEKAGVTFLTGIPLAFGDVAGFDKATWELDRTGEEVIFFSRESYTMSMTDWILAHPRDFLRLIYRNAQRFANGLFSAGMFLPLFVPLLTLAWFHAPWSKQRTTREGMLLISLGPALGFLLFVVVDRYIAVILPLLMVWLAQGLVVFADWLVGTVRSLFAPSPEAEAQPPARWRTALWALPVVVVLLFFIAVTPRVWARTSLGSYRPAHKTIGLWLQHEVTPDTVIMARYPAIAFHADARWVPTPNATYDEIMHYARVKGARYWVLDELETTNLRPQLGFLVQDGKQPPVELRLVYTMTSEGKRLVVYELVR